MLNTLPFEIIQLIVHNLAPSDLPSFRLVCRKLSGASLNRFGHQSFSTIDTDLSPASLQRLRKISKTKYFAPCVECLHIYHPQGMLGQGSFLQRHQSGFLKPDVRYIESLQTCLVHDLFNCRSFSFILDEYGSSNDNEYLTPIDALGLFLSIVATTKLPMKALIIQGKRGRLDTRRSQMHLIQDSQLQAVCSHLEELSLNYGVTPFDYGWVLSLLTCATKLQTLSMSFHDRTTTFMGRLHLAHFPSKLQRLELVAMCATFEAITGILLHHQHTLRSLSLKHAIVVEGARWATVFNSLIGRFSGLRELSLLDLVEKPFGTNVAGVTFSQLASSVMLPSTEVRSRGEDYLKSDEFTIRSVKDPVKLSYWGPTQTVVGVNYCGPEVDLLLGILAETAGTKWTNLRNDNALGASRLGIPS